MPSRMALDAPEWQRRPVALTPLIDVIFLLLLFFMLSSTFTRFAEIPLMNTGSGAADATAPLFVQLRPEEVALNGVVMPLNALPGAITSASSASASSTLLVTQSGDVTSQRLVDLLTLLRGMPGLTVNVLE